MAYTPPSGDAAHFATGYADFPRLYNGLGFKQPLGSYTAPLGNAVSAQFPTPPADYVAPLGSAADFTALIDTNFAGFGIATVDFFAEGHGVTWPPEQVGAASVSISITAEGHGVHGVNAHGSTSFDFIPEGHGVRGVTAAGEASIGFSAAGQATVVRYEVRGAVREQYVNLARSVRVYRRDTGELVGMGDSTVQGFRIHCGFEAREHYLVPIYLDNAAEDFAPPCANRVISVLAQDVV